MILIIGIILGILIVFNWSSIKNYMDSKFSNASEQVESSSKNSQEQEKPTDKSNKRRNPKWE